jgi:DNA-binding FadR family transcriptional regulator
MRIEAVKVRRLYLQVADQLSALISAGSLVPGDRLPSERELASQFGVSRPTVREAMIALEIGELVEIRSGSGVYVTATELTGKPKSPAEEAPGSLEILEARRIIEGETAALAAERADDSDITALRKQLAVIASEHASILDKEVADQAFHELIASASGNSALHSSIKWLWEQRNRSEISHHFHDRLPREGSTPVLRDHQAILDAIVAKQPKQARSTMHEHLQRVLDTILNS